jgi:hypothetical protein
MINLLRRFKRNKQMFLDVARESFLTSPDCPYARDPDICVPKGSGALRESFNSNWAYQ